MVDIFDIVLCLQGWYLGWVPFEDISVSRTTSIRALVCVSICVTLQLITLGKHFGLNLILNINWMHAIGKMLC